MAGFIADDVIAGAVGDAEREPLRYLSASRRAKLGYQCRGERQGPRGALRLSGVTVDRPLRHLRG